MEYLSDDDKLLNLEHIKYHEGFCFVIGIDEAGRGALAGPVVAAAVYLPRQVPIPRVNDSKQLSAKQLDELFDAVRSLPGVRFGIGEASAAEIDTLNILRATHLAMRRAAEQITEADFILVDGLPVRTLPRPSLAIVKGDAKSASIAAASILAKVHRDRLLVALAKQYPEYGFEIHKAYGTRAHLEALRRYGPCPEHRRSFAPVRELLTPPPEQLILF